MKLRIHRGSKVRRLERRRGLSEQGREEQQRGERQKAVEENPSREELDVL
jgi:hypothetical protein